MFFMNLEEKSLPNLKFCFPQDFLLQIHFLNSYINKYWVYEVEREM